MHKLLFASLFLLLTGCESLDRTLPPDTTDDDDGLVGTLPARDFYQSYFYDLYTREKALMTTLADQVQPGSNDAVALLDNRYPGIALFVLADGNYFIEYAEGRGGGYSGVTVLTSVMFQGTWNILAGRIELPDFATIEPSTRNETGLDIRFARDIQSGGLMGVPVALTARNVTEQGDENLLDTLLKKHGLRKVPPRPPLP